MAESGTAGDVWVELLQNGNAVGGAITTANSTSTTDLKNVSFTTIVRVLPNRVVF